MERMISLLNEKNHYLEKFYGLAEELLPNFRLGQFDQLEMFYSTREQILDIVKYIDEQINVESDSKENINFTNQEQRNYIKECLVIKDEYVSRIIEQDVEILACIETAKNLIIKELQEVRKAKKAIGGYKTPTFSNRLNEEA